MIELLPLVSIILPVYNGEKYLSEAIGSILSQTYRPTEIILVDDGSTDGSAEIAKRFSPAVKYCYQNNTGTGAARNRGVELAEGSFLAFMDADDVWSEDKLEVQMTAFRNNPKTEIVFGHVKQFHSPELDEGTRKRLLCRNEAMPGCLPPMMLIKREAFLRVGLFETNWRLGQDMSWIMRAREQGLREIMLPNLVYMRRIHKHNKGTTHRQLIGDRVRILKASLDRRRRLSGRQE
jgi:glycosyltransferase involved in cell wall biosynthesis